MAKQTKYRDIRIRFYAWLREKIGTREIVINKPFLFIELRNILAKHVSEGLDRIFDDNGNIRDGIMIGLNNKLVNKSKLKELFIREGDVLDIMPLGSGG